jgi:hypothetical protein
VLLAQSICVCGGLWMRGRGREVDCSFLFVFVVAC